MTTPSVHLDRRLERITTHLRAHVAERRAVIARLQGQLAGLVKAAVAPARDPVGARP
jgi:hypothetical protein